MRFFILIGFLSVNERLHSLPLISKILQLLLFLAGLNSKYSHTQQSLFRSHTNLKFLLTDMHCLNANTVKLNNPRKTVEMRFKYFWTTSAHQLPGREHSL